MDDDNPVISLITINFNDAIGLRRTIESVLAQDFKKFEHIIIDAASTDGSVEVIHAYEKKYGAGQLVWVSEKDKGIYDGMNKGVQRARGRFVNMLNSGDWLCPHALRIVAQHIEETPGVGVFGVLEKLWEERENTMIPVQIIQTYPAGLNRHTLAHQGLFFEKRLHDAHGLYREDLRLASDQAFIMEIFIKHQVRFEMIEQVLVNFLRGGRGDQGSLELLKLYEEYFPKKKSFAQFLKTLIKGILPYALVMWLWRKYKKKGLT